MNHLKSFDSLFENEKSITKEDVEAVLSQFDDSEREGIETTLATDDDSTDEELSDFMIKEYRLDPETMFEILTIRSYFLSGQHLKDALSKD